MQNRVGDRPTLNFSLWHMIADVIVKYRINDKIVNFISFKFHSSSLNTQILYLRRTVLDIS